MKVELIYGKDCPNSQDARNKIVQAFNELKLKAKWSEWEKSDVSAPEYVQEFGSPTILINGVDVCANSESLSGDSCRRYQYSDGTVNGTPALNDIQNAMKNVAHNKSNLFSGFSLNSSVIPAIGVALLPKLACPTCWPAYVGLLSALGVSVTNYTPYLLPLTVLFLAVAVFTLLFKATSRHGYRPFIFGSIASAIVVYGKFYLESDGMMFLGLGLLIVASVWNTWPKKSNGIEVKCAGCEPENIHSS